MDKSSPVYENFAKKMEAMSGKPKINRTTFKMGSGDLTQRVTNNERKITLLKNIFKTQKIEIGEKITPKVNTLEESLISTTQILGVISQKLQLDMDQRIQDQKKAFENQRKLNLADKRGSKEEELEAKKKSKIVKKLGKATIKPFVGIFDQLKQLGLILGTGIIGTNLIRLLKDEKFQEKLKGIYEWTTKNWKSIAIAGGTLLAIDFGLKLFGAFKIIKATLAFLASPFILKALALGALAYGVFYLFNNRKELLDKAFERRKQKMIEQSGSFDPNTDRNIDLGRVRIDPVGSFLLPAEGSNAFMRFLNRIGPGRKIDEEKLEAFKKYMAPSAFEVYQKYSRDVGSKGLEFFIPNLTSFLDDKALLKAEFDKLSKEKRIPKISFVDGGTVDLNKNNKIREFKQNNLPATEINTIASMNKLNPYMESVPKLFGFSDLVYN